MSDIRHHELWQREDELINQRQTWLFASQGLLFAAYGWLHSQAKPPEILSDIPWLGMLTTAFILLGICGAIGAQCRLWWQHGNDRQMYVHWICVVVGWISAVGLCVLFALGWWRARL